MSISADVILTLARVNPDSLIRATEGGTFDLIEMNNGALPDAHEMGTVLDATAEEWDAAATYLLAAAEIADGTAGRGSELISLLERYAAKADEPVTEVSKRMTPPDRIRLIHLVLLGA